MDETVQPIAIAETVLVPEIALPNESEKYKNYGSLKFISLCPLKQE